MGIAVDSLKKGFDFDSIRRMQTPFLVIAALNIVPVIGPTLSSVAFMVWAFPMILANYKLKSRFLDDKMGAFIGMLKVSILSSVMQLINWKRKNILYMQLGSFIGGLLLVLISIAVPNYAAILVMIALLLFLADAVIIVYNALRYSQTTILYFSTMDSVMDALDASWELTEGKIQSLLGLALLIFLACMAIFVPVFIIAILLVLIPVLGALLMVPLLFVTLTFLLFMGQFAWVNMFLAIRADRKPKSKR